MAYYTRRPGILIGDVYGLLTVRRELGKVGPRRFWECSCECGTSGLRVRQDGLKSGHVKSCGCLRAVAAAKNGAATAKHGMVKTPEYEAWAAMWQRCTNPRHKSYPQYKDRKPPEEWKDFEVFYAKLGPRPSKAHSLERPDNTKSYGPDNCEWALPAVQSRNKSNNINITYADRTQCATDWARELGIPVGVIRRRFHLGWPADKILSTPIHNRSKK